MVTGPGPALPRLRFLDASRGLTMFFVLLSHFAGTYFVGPEVAGWRWTLTRIGMIATPTFVILSGMLLGVHHQMAHRGFRRIQAKLIDRGLFLILLSHFVVAFPQGSLGRVLYSTDGLGFAMVFGALLVQRVRGYTRLAVGVTAYVVSWIAVYFWHPAAGVTGGAILKEAMFGSLVPTALDSGTFPIVPWFGVYLISSVFGQRLAALYARGSTRRLAAEFISLGIGGVAMAAGIEMVAWWFGVFRGARNTISALIWVTQKSPPAPLYLLLYCGAGMVLLGLCLVAERRGWFGRAFRHAVVCGEASLFVYFAHFYLLWLGRYLFIRGGVALGFAYFILSMATLVVAAHVWQRRAFNRVFTVRYQTAERPPWLRLDAVPVMWVEQPR
jgi:uncharacterized membrane protein